MRIYYFHNPPITRENQNKNIRRYTVAFTLEKTKTEKDQDHWLLSYGATIFTPATEQEKKQAHLDYGYSQACEDCKNNRGFCEPCGKNRTKLQELLHTFTWQKKRHIKLARERLLNNPLQFILFSEENSRMGYYQFRRIENFIISRIHHFGVSSLATENTEEYPEPVYTYSELGFDLLDKNLSKSEQIDYQNFLMNSIKWEKREEIVQVPRRHSFSFSLEMDLKAAMVILLAYYGLNYFL